MQNATGGDGGIVGDSASALAADSPRHCRALREETQTTEGFTVEGGVAGFAAFRSRHLGQPAGFAGSGIGAATASAAGAAQPAAFAQQQLAEDFPQGITQPQAFTTRLP